MSEEAVTTPSLADLIDDMQRNPVSAARPDKRGKFPMGAFKRSPDGSSMNMVSLEYAMTAENFERLRALISALGSQRALVTAAPALLEALKAAQFALFGAGPSTRPLYAKIRDAIAKAEGN